MVTEYNPMREENKINGIERTSGGPAAGPAQLQLRAQDRMQPPPSTLSVAAHFLQTTQASNTRITSLSNPQKPTLPTNCTSLSLFLSLSLSLSLSRLLSTTTGSL